MSRLVLLQRLVTGPWWVDCWVPARPAVTATHEPVVNGPLLRAFMSWPRDALNSLFISLQFPVDDRRLLAALYGWNERRSVRSISTRVQCARTQTSNAVRDVRASKCWATVKIEGKTTGQNQPPTRVGRLSTQTDAPDATAISRTVTLLILRVDC